MGVPFAIILPPSETLGGCFWLLLQAQKIGSEGKHMFSELVCGLTICPVVPLLARFRLHHISVGDICAVWPGCSPEQLQGCT